MLTRFRDRLEAGTHLAAALRPLVGGEAVQVLALPRGGVPVGYEVAMALAAPLDVFIVRKLGVPGHEELAMGALAEGGVRVLNRDVIGPLGIPPEVIERVTVAEQAELGPPGAVVPREFGGSGAGRPHGRAGGRRTGHRLHDGRRSRGSARAAPAEDRRGRARGLPGGDGGAAASGRGVRIRPDTPVVRRGRRVVRGLPPDDG